MRFIFVLLLVGMLVAAGCGCSSSSSPSPAFTPIPLPTITLSEASPPPNYVPFTAEDGSFRLSHPLDWNRIQWGEAGGCVFMLRTEGSSPEEFATLQVQRETRAGEDMTLGEYVQRWAEYLKSSLVDVQIHQMGVLSRDGFEAALIDFQAIDPAAQNYAPILADKPARLIVLHVHQYDILWLVTGLAPAATYDHYQGDFLSMLSSFHVSESYTPAPPLVTPTASPSPVPRGTPEESVAGYLEALEAKDLHRAVMYLADQSPQAINSMSAFFLTFKSWKFENIVIAVVSREKDRATVKVERDVTTVSLNDETVTVHRSQTAVLIKRDGNWLIESMQ